MKLTVLDTPAPASLDRAALAAQLAALNAGHVRFGRHDQMLYATDASNYQIEPLGVIVPTSVEDMIRIVKFCGERGVALLPRGGGTSLAGQCTNRALVVDHSAFCRRVLAVSRRVGVLAHQSPKAGEYAHPTGNEAATVHVEPGITVDELNRQLATLAPGFFFAPDPATSAQATIGGCIGNNAAGARSIRYGRTSENVAGLDVLLTTGERTWLEAGAGGRDPVARRLAEQVGDVVTRYASLIQERFPKTLRRNAGYALDLVLAQLDRSVAPADLDLSGLICGSEGTLAVVLGAKLKLHPIPKAKGLAIATFATLEDAINAVVPILKTGPSAVELLDELLLEAARGNAQCQRYMELLKIGSDTKAVLYIEYQSPDSLDEIEAGFALLRQALPGVAVDACRDQGAVLAAWALRKAGEPLLHGLYGHRKPVSLIEDNAVPVENLVRFVAGMRKIIADHGTIAGYYAHASVGVLHIRPMLDLHEAADREKMRSIAVQTADLARECGGVMSGEHGDGRVRGPLLERYFGAELMAAFREVKKIFDPKGILNPGMIVDVGPIESISENLRVMPEGRPLSIPRVETYFNYDDLHGFAGAVEMCNGAGVCRKTSGGVMCPSYRATADERHSTRGRGNALRLAISGQLPAGAQPGHATWDDSETMATLDLCLSCKACKSECPSNVDMARLKAEYTAQRYRTHGVPLVASVFGHVRRLNQFGSLMPGLANWLTRLGPVRAILDRVLGLAPKRTLPPFASSLYRWFARRDAEPHLATLEISDLESQISEPTVVLFADCFTTYNEPRIGQAVVRVLEALGYKVELPKVGCCGRSMISLGLLADAIKSADGVLAALQPFIDDDNVKAIVVCEPSCLSAMKDDWLQLRLQTPLDLRKRLAAKAMMPEEFVERFWDQHPIRPPLRPAGPIVYHGHCHQKAVWGEAASTALLRRLAGQQLSVLPSGCCGMAGSFGFAEKRYDLSMKIGEESLLAAVRSAAPDAAIVAPGTSCRHQIKDGTGRRALHPMEVLAEAMACQSQRQS